MFALSLLHAAPSSGQALLDRPPNLGGTAVPPSGTAEFTFLHRFQRVGEDTKKVVNYPTFILGTGVSRNVALGATYVSNSELGTGTPNEWELWGKWRAEVNRLVDISVMGAWNTAAESVDGEVTGKLQLSRLALLAAARGFSSAYDTDSSEAAIAAGVTFRLTPLLAVGADIADLVTGGRSEAAWSAGIQMRIPRSPHTLGFVVSNVGATTLQGASRGIREPDGDRTLRYGFAFTAPLGTLEQWARILHGEEGEASNTAVVRISDFAFGPLEIRVRAGETVRWLNDDPTVHTVTADDDMFDSGPLEEGEGYSRRFNEPGTYAYHCTPHPFMQAVIIVEPANS